MLHWYVARSKPGKEKIACESIFNQGIQVFLPLYKGTVRRLNAFDTKLRPVFPGYLFFHSPEDRAIWRAVGGSIGVSYVVWGDGRQPRPVPDSFMDDLIASCPEGVMSTGSDQLAVGNNVRVNVGPFSGHLGKILSLDRNDRVALLLDVMGSATVRMSVKDLQLANESSSKITA